MNPTITGELNFTANYDLTFDAAYAANHNIVFIFSWHRQELECAAWYFYHAASLKNTEEGSIALNGAIGNLSILAYCGNAWDYAYTSRHALTLV